MNKRKEEKPGPAPSEPAETLLAQLLREKGLAPAPPEAGRETAPAAPEPAAEEGRVDLARAGKIVLRRERKGRGGKTVTVLAGLSLPPTALERVARDLRKGLGCGSAVENGAIVLQGDLPERARAWLEERGARKVVLGN